MENRSTRHALEAAAAFAGLGFDLSAVAERAQAVRLRAATRPTAEAGPRWNDPVPRAAGFSLLVVLGREIRGR